MKCKICKNKITWDESFGKSSYIVCADCFKRLAEKIDKTKFRKGILLELIFEMGSIREETKEK